MLEWITPVSQILIVLITTIGAVLIARVKTDVAGVHVLVNSRLTEVLDQVAKVTKEAAALRASIIDPTKPLPPLTPPLK